MTGLAIALAGIAVVWLLIWAVRNDKVSSIADQKGLSRMVDHEAKEERKPKSGRRMKK